MGKTYIDTVKYLVYANVEIDGLVEKPDVVGAIFGQTEGLLGDELDLRELQKNGRIGRIEVDLTPRGPKSVGKIKLPSSLDMVETSILAASLETVDRVGPCDAHISIDKIEDTRTIKRKDLVQRAKTLLKTMLTSEIPESKEISEQVRSEVKTAEIADYGPEKLPAGPTVATMDSVILVEGRADVINLLKNDITNVVAVGGANVAKSIADLTRQKETTVFLDGDRGGDMILNELNRIGEIDFIARAPRGKEVEELTRKEIIKCLRSKIPLELGSSNGSSSTQNTIPASAYSDPSRSNYRDSPRKNDSSERYQRSNYHQDYQNDKPQNNVQPTETGYTGRRASMPQSNQRYNARTSSSNYSKSSPVQNTVSSTPLSAQSPRQILPDGVQTANQPTPTESPASSFAPIGLEAIPSNLLNSLGELENTLKARLYSNENTVSKEVPVRDMIKTLESEPEVFAVVFDGIITQRLADLAQSKKAKALVGIKLGNVFKKPVGVLLHTKQ